MRYRLLSLSTDNDPLYRFHQWQANLRVSDVQEIETVPFAPLSHPFVERLIGLGSCAWRIRVWSQRTEALVKGEGGSESEHGAESLSDVRMNRSAATSKIAEFRPGFRTLTPYLLAPTPEYVDFLKIVFDAKQKFRGDTGPGSFHAEFKIGDSMEIHGINAKYAV